MQLVVYSRRTEIAVAKDAKLALLCRQKNSNNSTPTIANSSITLLIPRLVNGRRKAAACIYRGPGGRLVRSFS